MASSTVTQQLQNYLAKLDDPSQTRNFLHKIYTLKVTKDMIFQYGADLVLNNWTSHATHGFLARRILEKWSKEGVAKTTSSSSDSSSDESTAPAQTASNRKRGPRHVLSHMSSTKKYKVDSDYEETDEEYADEYEEAIDEIIRRNLDNRPVDYKCVHSFMKSRDWQNCKMRMAEKKSS